MRIALAGHAGLTLFEGIEALPKRVEGKESELLEALSSFSPDRIGILVDQGGPNHFRPSEISEKLLKEIRLFSGALPLAEALLEKPLAKLQLLLFDTAFYQTLPLESATLGVSKKLQEMGIRRYGRHGYALSSLVKEANLMGRVVVAYLASFSSAVALLDGIAIDTKAHLLSWERPGSIPPSIAAKFPEVAREGGLKEIADAHSFDEMMRETPNQLKAMLAFEAYALDVKRAIGAMSASLGGIDTLVFSGSFGVRYPELRKEIAGGLEFLGIELDPKKNEANLEEIQFGSTTVRCIASSEEKAMLRDVAFYRSL